MSIDDHCDGSCSNVYPAPGTRLLSHEEVERQLDKAMKPDYVLKYNMFMYGVQDKHPIIYRFLKSLKVPHPY